MKVKSIKTVEVKEIGAINLNNIEAVNGNLLVHIPISHANEGLEELVNKLYKDFLEKHPDVDEKEICVDVNVQYTFGGWMTGVNSDFILDIYLWQESNEDVVEDYDDIPLYLGEEGTRTVKKLIWDELMAENDSAMQSSLKNANSYREAILNIVTSQSKAVQDAMFKEIDARKKALKKKKEYYDYDKTISKKTDEIELIKQQIRGLEGLTDAESKAQKAKLEASLKDKQDDLDDTVRDHVYDITVNGLDDLETQLSEDFEKWSNQLSSDLESMSGAISDAIRDSGMDYDDMENAIGKILKQFGLNPLDYFTSKDISSIQGFAKDKYAKGTKHVGGVPRVAMTNENGREIIVTKKGILTPVEPSDGIIPNDMTETLMKMAMDYQNYSMPEIKIPDVQIINKDDSNGNVVYNNHYDTLLTVQGDVTKDVLPDLKTILKQASEYTQNDIRKNKRRFG